MPQSWPLSRQQILDASGRPLLVPSVRFYAAGTTEPLTPFADPDLSTALPTPCPADGTGRFPRIFLASGLYKEEVRGPYGELLWSDDGLGTPDAVDPVDGGGSPPDATAVASTGDVKWRPDTSILPGWVRMNGRTIGSASSGATELARDTTQALYVHLWNTFDQSIAPVIGGRGDSALSDFASNKPITVPSMQGCIAAGLDDMGAPSAGRLQATKNAVLVRGSATVTINSADRVAIGMFVAGTGVPFGTVVTDLVGTTVTLSQPATAAGAAVLRFSPYRDAQSPGQIGGSATQKISNRNLPTELPGASVSIDYPSHNYVAPNEVVSLTYGDGGAGTTITGILRGTKVAQTGAPGAKTFNASQPNAGGGVAFVAQPPSRLGTYFIKL